ncbi:MAG: DNRLRE domain-containing protein [Nanoarchaeota archaeon]|nr:DNRLRE domain-containing protein [Nanoarchaeota archaeon]
MNLVEKVNDSFFKKSLKGVKRFALPFLVSSVLLMGCGKKGDEAPTSPNVNQTPTVEIISGPTGTIYENEATFSWQGYDNDGEVVGYDYKLPPKINDYDYTIFNSLNFIFLDDGEDYTLYVKAKDDDGAYSSSATRSFSVDLGDPAGSSGTTNSNGDVNLNVNNNNFTVHVSTLGGSNLSNVLVTGDYYGSGLYEFLAEKSNYYSNVNYHGDYGALSNKGGRSLDDLINISMKNKTSNAHYKQERDAPYMANNPRLDFIGTATLGDLANFYQEHDALFEDVSFLEFVNVLSGTPDPLTFALEMNQFRIEFINNISNVNSVINDIASYFGGGFDEDVLYYDFYLHKTLNILTHCQNTQELCTVKGVVDYNSIPISGAYVSILSGPITSESDYTNSSGEYILKFLTEGTYNFKASYNSYEDLKNQFVAYSHPPYYLPTTVNFDIESQQQQIITIQPGPNDGKDAYVMLQVMTSGDTLHTNENYGDENAFNVTDYYNPFASWTTIMKERSFFQFTIPSYIEDVVNATLCMQGVSSDLINVQVRRVMDYWGESTITWNNQPSYTSYVYDNKNAPYPADWTYFDVTDLVQKWIDGVYPNYGFALTTPQPGSWNQYFSYWGSTSDWVYDPSITPKLEIIYEE